MRACRICGCTDNEACVDALGEPCCWVASDLCSFCALGTTPDDPALAAAHMQIYSEAEANAFLRGRG